MRKSSMSPRDLITVIFEPDGTKTHTRKGTKILDALRKTGLTIRSECGGQGICGQCKVIVKDAWKFSDIADSEQERLSASELRLDYRLACACSIFESATVYIPEESRLRVRKLLIEGIDRAIDVEPAIRKLFIEVPKPSLLDVRSDVQRLYHSLINVYQLEQVDLDFDLLKTLPRILRKADWKVTVTVWNATRIISVERGDTTHEALGIAIDIGTSKIICYLLNLINGELLHTSSSENPQVVYGEDIISRISYASQSNTSLKRLQKLVVDCINTLIFETCKQTGRKPQHIYEVTVVGNTAMHHIFLGLQPKYLGLSPYVPVTSGFVNEKARNRSLKTNPFANVHVFPVIAGFVGGDAVADIVATGMFESGDLSMMVDIGTNTEVILGDKGGMMACSCASGPAFEGAHIKCGIKAVTGAIEKLEMKPETYEVDYQTIGSAKPIGLCGSAIIDTVANLLECRVIDKSGTFADLCPTDRLRTINGEKTLVLVSRKEGAARDILITQKDVREVQLAKAAIYTGCYILMKRMNIAPKDIKRFYIAGAFGNYINPKNAKLIGMIPDIHAEAIKFVGNAAGAGARMALISRKLRDKAWSITQKVIYVELAADAEFQKEFASAMYFPHKDLDRFQSVKNLF